MINKTLFTGFTDTVLSFYNWINPDPRFDPSIPPQHLTPILELNSDLVRHVGHWLKPEQGQLPTDVGRLATTCTFFHAALKAPLNAFKLVQHVVHGEEKEAKAMLEASPGLLLQSATVTDYSGRTIKNATAYQAALGAMDVDMVKMITPYFAQLNAADGEQKRINQYNEQFPNGLPEPDAYDFSALVDIITQASEADLRTQLKLVSNDSSICKAIKTFRKDIEANDVIDSGLHFNYQTLAKAFDVYEAQYDNWTDNKRDLFSRQVIGYVQRFMPACDAQAFAQGVYGITDEGASLTRSFKFEFGGSSIFPPRHDQDLGFHFAAGGNASGCVGSMDVVGAAIVGARLQKLYAAKTSYISKPSPAEPTSSLTC